MASGSGLKGAVGLAFQTTLTAAAGVGSCHWLPFVSETITLNQPRLDGASIRARADEPLSYQGVQQVAGDIVFEPDPYMLAVLGYATLGGAITSVQASWAWHSIYPNTSDFSACCVPPFTLFIARDVGCGFRYYGCVANQLSIEYASGALAKATLSVIGMTGGGITQPTPTFVVDETKLLPWSVTSFGVAAAGAARMQALTLTVNNNLEMQATLAGVTAMQRVRRTNFRQFRFGGQYEIEDMAEWARFLNNSAFELEAISTVNSANWAHTHAPQAIYEGVPVNIPGPGPITSAIAGRMHFDTTSWAFTMTCQTSVANALIAV